VSPADAVANQPLDLLSACHRRIEQRLALLDRIAAAILGDDPAPTAQVPDAIGYVVSYFARGLPRHVADEDVDLFPLLRRADPALDSVILALEVDHRGLEFVHNELDAVLAELRYSPKPARARHLAELAAYITPLYQRHLRTEDEVVFPRAREVLRAEQIERLGAIFKSRRNLPP
ncbi:MAG: hemerythrin domain-containing protein, partial [Cyanobacteria bacterium REEB65]|nr:hemerythrin domain-containing protein [Cyanobacteria bacterium REEB65]